MLAGLVAGQIFAEGNSPLAVVNTFKIGYDDNLRRSSSGEESSMYIEDLVNLAFRAALSDRTDLLFRSEFKFHSDDDRQKLDPNIYMLFSHAVSSRFLLQLSEYYRGGYTPVASEDGQYDYVENTLTLTPSYVLTPKDRLEFPLSHTMICYEDKVEYLDYERAQAGITWKRDIIPQRTWVGLNLRQRYLKYDKREETFAGIVDGVDVDVTWDGTKDSQDITEITAELNHTFTPEWRGNIEAGVTYVQPDNRDYELTIEEDVTRMKGDNSKSTNPYFAVGLAYSPSPRTRVIGDFSYKYLESTDARYGAKTTAEVRFGVQHDFTARIMGKATVRLSDSVYDEDDSVAFGAGRSDEERMSLNLSLRYKINRINSLVLGLRHSEKKYGDDQGDWDQNMIDLGWRVDL